MIRSLIALTLTGMLAVPASAAGAVHVYRSHHVSTALRAGCAVQQVHLPAGKTGHSRPAPILRCPGPVEGLGEAKVAARR